MPADDIQPHLNGWQKRDIVEGTLKSGDASKAQSILDTVQDQKLFMTLLADKARDDSGLGHLQITDGKDGSPQSVKTDKLVVTLESSPDGEKLVAHGVDTTSRLKEAVNNAETRLQAAIKPLTDSWRDFEEAWRNKGTDKSIVNQGINRQIERATGGAPAPDVKPDG
jgi:hypothetical protein